VLEVSIRRSSSFTTDSTPGIVARRIACASLISAAKPLKV
jgi:hypothetical protein